MKPVRIGTRSSALAMWQAQWVQQSLSAIGLSSEIVPLESSGDNKLDLAIKSIAMLSSTLAIVTFIASA